MYVPVLAGWKGGLRLALAILIFALINNLVEGPAKAQGGDGQCGSKVDRIYNVIHQSALWCAVTVCVVIAPEYVGATTWLCFQRLMGNIAGGWLACGFVIAIRNGIGLAFVSFFVVFATFVAKIRDLTRFGGFFAVTYVIVSFQGYFMGDRDVVILAGTRVLAISIGVVTALVLTCVVFPISASGSAVLLTKDTLEATTELNRLAWSGLVLEIAEELEIDDDDDDGSNMNGDTVIKMRADQDIIDGNAIVRGSPPIAGIRVMLARMLGHIKGKVQAAMQGSSNEATWDGQVSRTYVGYANYLEAMFNARNEIYVGKVFDSRWFAPSIKWVSHARWHMPIAQMWAVRVALREVRRAVFGIQQFIVDGFGDDLMEVLQKVMPPEVLLTLKTESTAALESMCALFPGQSLQTVGWAPSEQIERYINAAEALLEASTAIDPDSTPRDTIDEANGSDGDSSHGEKHTQRHSDSRSAVAASSRDVRHPVQPDSVGVLDGSHDVRCNRDTSSSAPQGENSSIQEYTSADRTIIGGIGWNYTGAAGVQPGTATRDEGHRRQAAPALPSQMHTSKSSGSLIMDAILACNAQPGALPQATESSVPTVTGEQLDTPEDERARQGACSQQPSSPADVRVPQRRISTQEYNQQKWQDWRRKVATGHPGAADKLSDTITASSTERPHHHQPADGLVAPGSSPTRSSSNAARRADNVTNVHRDSQQFSLDARLGSDRASQQSPHCSRQHLDRHSVSHPLGLRQLSWSSTRSFDDRRMSGSSGQTSALRQTARDGSWQREVEAAASEFRNAPSSPYGIAAAWHQQALTEAVSDKDVRDPPSLAIRDEAPSNRQQSSSRRHMVGFGLQGLSRKLSSGAGSEISQMQFPDTLATYVSQVRWNGFIVLLVTLGGALARLHACINELLPLLPGSTLLAKDAPPPVQLERWGRVDVTLQEMRSFLRSTQPGVGAGQAEGTVYEKAGGGGEHY